MMHHNVTKVFSVLLFGSLFTHYLCCKSDVFLSLVVFEKHVGLYDVNEIQLNVMYCIRIPFLIHVN